MGSDVSINEKTKNFTDLFAWQRAHEFVCAIYSFTKNFPKEELFGLTSQFRRAAVSIAANIAEGYKKTSQADKLRFFNIAQGSLEECRYYIILSHDLEYLQQAETEKLNDLLSQTSILLNKYCSTIKQNQ